MRFATRVDAWIVVLLAVVALVSCVPMPLTRLVTGSGPPLWFAFVPSAVWAIVLAFLLPQFYELRGDGLFIRQGIRKILLPYASIAEVQRFSSPLSSGAVFSNRRILLVSESGRRDIIAVAEEERFLNELARRCPQLSGYS